MRWYRSLEPHLGVVSEKHLFMNLEENVDASVCCYCLHGQELESICASVRGEGVHKNESVGLDLADKGQNLTHGNGHMWH